MNANFPQRTGYIFDHLKHFTEKISCEMSRSMNNLTVAGES